MPNSIAILDFGSQYTQLIGRRVREQHIYCEIFPFDMEPGQVLRINPQGFILSGGPNSVYEAGSPQIPQYILDTKLPVLGICYGMQAMAQSLGGRVVPGMAREYGHAVIQVENTNQLLRIGEHTVWMSHGDRVEIPPVGFQILATTPGCPVAAMGDEHRRYYGLQFHPEVRHTSSGAEFLRNFLLAICRIEPDWTAQGVIHASVESIRHQVGDAKVLSAVSGGVDSSVATALVHRAVGEQLHAIFVDHGMLRQDERTQVETAFNDCLGLHLKTVDASTLFLGKMRGVTDPESKRRIIGETFIRVFEAESKAMGSHEFLVQGTIYPDVIESRAPERGKAEKIKTHHNVGGLPESVDFALIEPLRYLFKDEVREIGEALGLPHELVWRQPFPGPGLAVRCLGEVTPERLDTLRKADAIFTEELSRAGLLTLNGGAGTSQAFAALLPVRSVGVMGDQRTYQETAVLRAVTTEDFMTADWAKLPHDLLSHVSNRIVNEVKGINRVVYDITSKPPSTIEWE